MRSICVRRSDATFFFFFNDTATTEIYTLSLHDALPISRADRIRDRVDRGERRVARARGEAVDRKTRSEEHTSELQSQSNIVCRLLLEKKKNKNLVHLDLTAGKPRTAPPRELAGPLVSAL